MPVDADKPTLPDLNAALIEVAPIKTVVFVIATVVGFACKLSGYVDVGLVAIVIALATGVALYRQRMTIQASLTEKVRNRTEKANH
ncbi:hypothetical protein [Pseudomonas fluorescens]|uniref:hypothetical protein n=1 Tax=Pseudomonas fluorescens TaxID=294 RepID=UPI001BE72888|nr:hypothetical protein [Pseudomonas fluorescens]MBT2375556.1 hypothetical protein [Pseudomonas fluorescens]